MSTKPYELQFDGRILQRGFWLYVWEITPPKGAALYYVGRTGDSSSTNAQSPFNRMGQHLGFGKGNMLRQHLLKHDAKPDECEYRLLAVGPLEEESTAATRDEHDKRRDVVAAMEKALADAMTAAGCQVMNEVDSLKPLDKVRFAEVRAVFAKSLPVLAAQAGA